MDNWSKELVQWYQENKRDLPWRRSKDPYGVWISEIMLQQTRVEAVIGYYQRFMEKFPTIQALAEAPIEQVLKAWEGLGYYSRARNLHKAAQVIMTEWQGEFPAKYEAVLALPGIGEYTAGAICSIARGEARPAVDGNVLRVISRIYAIEEDVLSTSVKRQITMIAEQNIPEGLAGEYTQSLMDLGAGICIPKYPRCSECPIASQCQAYAMGIAADLPHKKKKKPPKEVFRYVVVVKKDDKVLLTRRNEQNVLPGMWEFPGIDVEDPQSILNQDQWSQEYGVITSYPQFRLEAEHIFSHIHWKMCVYEAEALKDAERNLKQESCWVDKEQLEALMLPTAFRAIRKYVMENL